MIRKSLTSLTLLLSFIILNSCKVQHPDLEDGLYAEIITSKGTMVAKLHYDKVPVTVANFVALAEGNHPMVEEKYEGKPFFDSIIFHRVMDKFMIQGGDPTGTGRGTPGYRFAADFDASLKHDKAGILSMANSGGINTNGSQFFITEVPYPSLNAFDDQGNMKPCDQPRVSCHSVFGELVQGVEVQDSISNVEVIDPRARNNRPVEDVYITKVNIIRKGKDAKRFDAPKVFTEDMPKVEPSIRTQLEDVRKKIEEERRLAEEKKAEVALEFKPTIEDYTAKAKATSSGLLVYNLQKGTGDKPNTGQTALINYQAYFTDGILLDSNVKDVEEKYGMLNPQKVQLNRYVPAPMKITPDASLVAGFKEALAMMRVGEKSFFYMPSHLAYGEAGRPPVKPNTDLVFIIEMVGIQN